MKLKKSYLFVIVLLIAVAYIAEAVEKKSTKRLANNPEAKDAKNLPETLKQRNNAHPTSASRNLKTITVRTAIYPRPPYSGATYFIYERNGEVICTKIETCNKFDECTSEYKKGPYLEDGDDKPSSKSEPVQIDGKKLKSHKCLSKFGLL